MINIFAVNNFLNAITILFIIIFIGYFLGKIKIYSISLDLSAILIVAMLMGFILSRYYPIIFDEELNISFDLYSKLGTALFMSVISISASRMVTENSFNKCLIYIGIGTLIVCIGFIATKVIALFDRNIENSLLLGILCGAMTSSPGLAAIYEMANIDSTLATFGYGTAYLIGVIGVVLYVQIFTLKTKIEIIPKSIKMASENKSYDLLYISIIALTGQLIGNIKLSSLNYSLGTSGGILIVGIIGGIFIKDRISNDLSTYQNLGLVMFLAGNGISAGRLFNDVLNIKWLIYGAIIMLSSVVGGDILAKLIFKENRKNRMCIIAGGMTSTPAIGVLIKKCKSESDVASYSLAYLGALLTMTIGVKLFFM
ncbi:MAG: hypothetical protein U0K93_02320 [Acutalibacteraceae bacterium]|nr:hypothetical protein [Acutalibacteraceae bacterium]